MDQKRSSRAVAGKGTADERNKDGAQRQGGQGRSKDSVSQDPGKSRKRQGSVKRLGASTKAGVTEAGN